ncbi:MAG: dTDP-4-dehydrorhamnose reductase [Thermoleophilaceae bacterium]|nr:dTDP-4-dehydrorhamnose reductase [Thermoleophilaceae bacterium]
MRILVTGAAGLLATDIFRAAQEWNHETTGLERRDLDVTDARAVLEAFHAASPDAVVNCAGYTDVDGAEGDPRAAAAVNSEGARNVAIAAAELDIPVVYPSTDYVFDGVTDRPYVETDEPRPLSAYGHTKLAGEIATAEVAPRHFIVRTSWLFGTGGANFVETMLRLAADHGDVLVVRDQIGCPTYTAHLADAIVRLVASQAYGIHHIAGAGGCSWYEFAAEIFAQAGVAARLMSCTTEEFSRPAKRPPYSVLDTIREAPILLPGWEIGLAGYLQERVPA